MSSISSESISGRSFFMNALGKVPIGAGYSVGLHPDKDFLRRLECVPDSAESCRHDERVAGTELNPDAIRILDRDAA